MPLFLIPAVLAALGLWYSSRKSNSKPLTAVQQSVLDDASKSQNPAAIAKVAGVFGAEGYASEQSMLLNRASLPVRAPLTKKAHTKVLAHALACGDADIIENIAGEMKKMGMSASAEILDVHGRGARRAKHVRPAHHVVAKHQQKHGNKPTPPPPQDGSGGGGSSDGGSGGGTPVNSGSGDGGSGDGGDTDTDTDDGSGDGGDDS